MPDRVAGLWWRAYLYVVTRGRFVSARGSRVLRPSSVTLLGAGARVVLGPGAVIAHGGRIVVKDATLTLGADSYVGEMGTLVAFADLTIGDRALLGERVSVHTEDHGPAGARDRFVCAPVVIGADAWLCAGSIVTKGVTVGERSTVAANAVVTRDVPADVLTGGIPAKVIRQLDAPSATPAAD